MSTVVAPTGARPGTGLRLGGGVALLGLLALAGAAVGIWRLVVGLGATTALNDGYPWGLWIGLDFTLIAFSGAGFTLAVAVHVLRLKQLAPALRPALLAGLLGYLAVAVLLVLDLGRPDRFYHFLYLWNVHSPLFEISWCVLLYSLVLVIECIPFASSRPGGPAHQVHRLAVPAAIVGLTLSSLHQSTLGTLYLNMAHRLDALWFSPILSLLFFVSAVAAGLALALVAYVAASRLRGRASAGAVVAGLGQGAAWASLVYLALKLLDLAVAGELGRLLVFDRLSLLLLAELVPGALVPAALLLSPALRARVGVAVLAALLILAGVLLNRFSATWFAQAPLRGGEYSPHPLEWISTLGVLAGAVLIWILGVRFLRFFEDDAPA